jgi:predicted acetyltransferase
VRSCPTLCTPAHYGPDAIDHGLHSGTRVPSAAPQLACLDPFPAALNRGTLCCEGQLVLKLLQSSADKKEAFLRMAQDWLDHGNDRYRLAVEDFDVYLAKLRQFSDPAQVPQGWVPSTEFWLDDGTGEIVACVRLRFWLTPSLEVEGGHVGYAVRPSARGRGYGTAALRLVLPEARRRGLERVRVTADSDNLPSIAIIERNGGVLDGEVISERTGKSIKQYWIDTFDGLPPSSDIEADVAHSRRAPSGPRSG